MFMIVYIKEKEYMHELIGWSVSSVLRHINLWWLYNGKLCTDADNADDIAILANTPNQTLYLYLFFLF